MGVADRGKTPVGFQKGSILPQMGSGSFSMFDSRCASSWWRKSRGGPSSRGQEAGPWKGLCKCMPLGAIMPGIQGPLAASAIGLSLATEPEYGPSRPSLSLSAVAYYCPWPLSAHWQPAAARPRLRWAARRPFNGPLALATCWGGLPLGWLLKLGRTRLFQALSAKPLCSLKKHTAHGLPPQDALCERAVRDFHVR